MEKKRYKRLKDISENIRAAKDQYNKIYSDYMKKVGNTLRANRENKGISQDDLSAATLINKTTIYGIETGVAIMSLKNMIKICDALDISRK